MSSLENEKDVVYGDKSNYVANQTDAIDNTEYKDTYRHLKPRHVQLIAISGAIGTGLYIGTAGALARAGPLGLLLGYTIYGVLILFSFQAMGEMVSYLPIDGSYLQFSLRFVDDSFGFAMGWMLFYNYAMIVGAEAVAVAGLVNYWNDTISNGVWCALFLVSSVAVHLFGVKHFGEAEFWLSIFKVLLILGLLVYTFITMVGGNPGRDAFGFRYWKNPGAMNEYIAEGGLGRFAGIWSTFVGAAFAYGSPDYLAMTSGEAKMPRRVMPNVFKRVVWRLLVFYIGGVLAVGILMPSNDPDLGSAKKGAGSSAFVLSAVRMGIPVLPSIINACILTSAWSCGLANVFTSSRILYSLAIRSQAPRLFLKTWKGVPWVTVLVVNAIACLSFLSVGDGGAATAFSWLVNILGSIFIFGLILTHIVYLRFRAGVAAQGLDRSSFPYYVKHQAIFSWISVFGYSIIFLTNAFPVFTAGNWTIRDFIFGYITMPIFFFLLIGHKIYSVMTGRGKWGFIKGHEMDLTTGKAEVDEDELRYPPPPTTKSGKFLAWLWGA